MRYLAISCIFVCALGASQPTQAKFKTIVDLRPLLTGSNATEPTAIYFRDGGPNLVATLRAATGGHSDAYAVPISAGGVMGNPVKLNGANERGSGVTGVSSWFDSRGNFYYYSYRDGIWKFNGILGPRIGGTPNAPVWGFATNSYGNLFTATSRLYSTPETGPNDSTIKRFSTGLVQNFSYQEGSTYRSFERMLCDEQDNLWVFGYTYEWDQQILRDTGYVVRKYSPQMNLLFEKTIPGLPAAVTQQVVCDSLGNIYSTGYGSAPHVLRKMDAGGNLLWQKPLGGPTGSFSLTKMTVDELGRVSILVNGDTVRFKQFSPAGNVLRDIVIPGAELAVALREDTFGQLYALTRHQDPNNLALQMGRITKFDAAGVLLFSRDLDTFAEDWEPKSFDLDSKTGDIFVASEQRSQATVSAVHAITQSPVARPDSLSVPSGVQISLPVFANDRYIGSFPHQFVITKPPMHGKILTGSSVYYKSDPGYHGPDEFSYRAVRNGLQSFPAKVNLIVN